MIVALDLGIGGARGWISKFAEIDQNLIKRPTDDSKAPFASPCPLFLGKKSENCETFLIFRYTY